MLGNAQINGSGQITRRVIDLSRKSQHTVKPAQPWDVRFSGADATFTDCIVTRGPKTIVLADIEYTVTGADGIIYLALEYDTETDTAAIIEDATMTDVIDATTPAIPQYTKTLLYKIRKSTASTVVSIGIVADYRNKLIQVISV